MRTSTRPRWKACAVLALAMAALVTTPATAALGGSSIAGATGGPSLASVTVRRPDGRIRWASSGYPGRDRATNLPFVGNNVYNTTGTSQTAVVKNFNEVEGAFYSFDISIQNDGTSADRFRIRATGTGTAGWTISYSRGSTTITSAVVAGTYSTPSLKPGATYLIRARMTVKAGGDATRLVTIRSVATPSRVDAVKFAYRQVSCGC